jgi:repressor LexA
MVEDAICDGDYVVVRQQHIAENGDTVVALIDGEATLKRYYREKGQVELRPANSSMTPIVIGSHQHLRILGVYVGLIRMEK